MANTNPCSRCSGAGRLAHHANVIGGVCFKCAGTGVQKSKRSAALPSWTVFAVERASGLEVSVCRIRAKSEDQAVAIARTQLARGTGYVPDSARVEVVA